MAGPAQKALDDWVTNAKRNDPGADPSWAPEKMRQDAFNESRQGTTAPPVQQTADQTPNGWEQQSDFIRNMFTNTWKPQGVDPRKRWETEHAAELKEPNVPIYVQWKRGNPNVDFSFAPPDVRYAAWVAANKPDYNAQNAQNTMTNAQNAYMPGGASVAARRPGAGALYPEDVASELAARRLSEQFRVPVDIARRLIQTEGWAPYKRWAEQLAASGGLDYLLESGWQEPGSQPEPNWLQRYIGGA